MSFKIYSIESRKGGVGKTTIALNLAQLLSSKYPVLLLDMDITGTSITEPARLSPFWREKTNVLKDIDGKELNLLDYFLNTFIRGKSLDSPILSKEMLNTEMINVIGSEIYGPTSKAVVNTRILMDEIHTYWLVDLIRIIIDQFQSFYPDDQVQIIIDNSPGYIGICEALHNYMYNLGPEVAKFIMVSSFDAQDLRASISALKEIQYFVSGRNEIAKYAKAIIAKEGPRVGVKELIKSEDNFKQFYSKLVEKKELIDQFVTEYLTEDNYSTLIINKVPLTFVDDKIILSFNDIVGHENIQLFNLLTSAKEDIPNNIIYYDETIAYQNYLIYLKSISDERDQNNYWKRRLRDLENQNIFLAGQPDLIDGLKKLDTLYNNLLVNMNQRGYARMNRQMFRQWAPSFAINRLGEILAAVLRRVYTPANAESKEKKEKIHDFINKQLQSLSVLSDVLPEYNQLLALASYVEEQARAWDDTISEKPMEMIAIFIEAFVKLCIEAKKPELLFRDFLLQIYRKDPYDSEYNDYMSEKITITSDYEIDSRFYIRYGRVQFFRFVRHFSYAVIRMCDVHHDFDFLLSALKLYVINHNILPFSRTMLNYLNHVIYYKDADYNFETLSLIKQHSYEMQDVQSILKNIVNKRWLIN